MTKVKHPVVSKLSQIKDRLIKNPVVHGMGNIVIALITLSREFYIANHTLHQDHSSGNHRRMRHT
ncbi:MULTISPECIES: hypothetical protein [Planktothricoides]|uniref:Uncharacterized protein n=2 Tax=Planktothricoides raciborskii TaxID=132608 RepID=A0AAU8J8X9_9CYAN|nr:MULTISPECIES: hypothetical protein [Planktothricoides]MBD2543861.1 hypothetical protein [Planktothricoides raciborskii FACHB-1370]MBD2583142.1 hypothetical protein [Planktothricoides raciborskii FACHB-1261]